MYNQVAGVLHLLCYVKGKSYCSVSLLPMHLENLRPFLWVSKENLSRIPCHGAMSHFDKCRDHIFSFDVNFRLSDSSEANRSISISVSQFVFLVVAPCAHCTQMAALSDPWKDIRHFPPPWVQIAMSAISQKMTPAKCSQAKTQTLCLYRL